MVFIKQLTRFGLQTARQLRATPLNVNRQWRSLHLSSSLFGERRYTDKHEWVELDGAVCTIGISQYAQEALGDVVFAQLPEPGTKLAQHDECGALESVKAASEVYSPLTGEVTIKNLEVEDTPGLINTSCYEKGWLFKLTPKDPAEFEKLMTEEQYKEFLKSSDH